MYRLKISVYLLILLLYSFWGCIRHTDQQIPRKTENTNKVENHSIKRITTNLMVMDVNQTADFYRKIVGFDLVTTVPDTGSYDFAILSKDGIEIMLQKNENMIREYPVFENKEIGGTFTLFFEVYDILTIYEKASTQAQIVKELHQTFYGTKEFSMKDNNGYILTFSELLK